MDGVSLGGSDDGHPPPLITWLSDWPHHREPEDEYDPWREIGQWSDQELADHNLDWQVPTDPFGLVCSLTDHLPGTKLDLVNIGRSLDLLAIYIPINNCFTNCSDCKDISHLTDSWIMDSGASIHFTGTQTDFSNLMMFPITE